MAIYAAYALGAEAGAAPDRDGGALRVEAALLAQLTVQLAPHSAEAKGLSALTLYHEARAAAARTPDGRYAPLAEQDPARWRAPLFAEAERSLAAAARLRAPGRFQTEAAIQSLRMTALRAGRTADAALMGLYETLQAQAPTLGVRVAYAVAVGETRGPEAGLDALDAAAAAFGAAAVDAYQPYWAARRHLALAAGRSSEGAAAALRAIALSTDPAIRIYLRTPAPQRTA